MIGSRKQMRMVISMLVVGGEVGGHREGRDPGTVTEITVILGPESIDENTILENLSFVVITFNSVAVDLFGGVFEFGHFDPLEVVYP
jgi:hypothetical protein